MQQPLTGVSQQSQTNVTLHYTRLAGVFSMTLRTLRNIPAEDSDSSLGRGRAENWKAPGLTVLLQVIINALQGLLGVIMFLNASWSRV